MTVVHFEKLLKRGGKSLQERADAEQQEPVVRPVQRPDAGRRTPYPNFICLKVFVSG